MSETSDSKAADESASKFSESEEAKTSDNAKPSSGRRNITLTVVALVVVIGVAAGSSYYFYARQFATTDDAFIDADIVRVSAQESGTLVEVPVTSNQRVKAGDILARIDPSVTEAALRLRQAQLAQAKAAMGEAEAGIAEAKAALEGAKSNAAGADVTAQNALTKAERYAEIVGRSGDSSVSTQTLDDTVATADEAEAAAAAARTQVTTAESRLEAAEAKAASAAANIAAAEASVSAAMVNLGHMTLTASIDGQVVQNNVNLGSYVAPGTQLMAIVPNDLYVTANYKETQLSQIKVGQPVDIKIDAFPDVNFTGKVVSIQNGSGQAFQLLPPQNATGNFVKVVQRVPVRISIDSPDLSTYPIGPGLSVVPSIRLEN